MALLEDAKKSVGRDDTEDKKTENKHKKKKARHPATPSMPSQPEGDEGEESNDAGDQDQPDAGADDSESEGAPEGGGASGGPPAQGQQGGGEDDEGSADAGGDQGDAQQPAQGVGGQGASPVPSPAAPGAGDTTSGGADTPDQDPNAQPPETPGENTAVGPGSENDIQQIPMSPGLQDEYNQANELLMQLLYKSPDNKLASGLLQGLMPQGPGKIKNAAMLSIDVLIQLHKRLQLPPQLVLPVAKDVVAHVMNLGEQVKQIQYSDQESTAILGCVVEGVLRVFGVKKSQLQTMGRLFGKDALMKQQAKYQQFHAHAKTAIDQNNQDWHHPELGGQQQAGGSPGPQTGAPVGAQPQAPQSGAPPQPQVPAATPAQQGAAGGMLSQAAQGAQ